MQQHDERQLESDHEIWRYMDFTKFVSLISTGALWFARMDTFEDKWEGFSRMIPLSRLRDTRDSAVAYYETEVVPRSERWRRSLPRQLFINCWSGGSSESVPMWKIYGSYDSGVAIRSTVGRLFASIVRPGRLPFRVDKVRYYDDRPATVFDYNQVADGSWETAFRVALEKRSCFEFECEWRAVVYAGSTVKQRGICVPVDLNCLIDGIRVSPVAPKSFLRTVAAVSEKVALKVIPRKSELASRPARQGKAVLPNGVIDP